MNKKSKYIKKIGFITTGHLSTNPRLVKEITTAFENGIEGEVTFMQFLGFLTKHDDFLKQSISGFSFNSVSWLTKSKLMKGIEKILHIVLRDFNSVFFHPFGYRLWKKAPSRVCCIIGHNLGTLPVISRLAKRDNIPFIFDLEDFHPGETMNENERNRRIRIMQHILPNAAHITYAAPLIGQKLVQLLGDRMPPATLINNNFPSIEFDPPQPITGKVKFVWFSQTLSYGRGLELIIQTLANYTNNVHLTLIGNAEATFIKRWVTPHSSFIEVIPPMTQLALHHSLANYDVGLALELSDIDDNRPFCLTNKIWAYLQSGLYIMATDTPAQVQFMDIHSSHGIIVQQNVTIMTKSVTYILENIAAIRNSSSVRYEVAKGFSWDVEKLKFLNLLSSAIAASNAEG